MRQDGWVDFVSTVRDSSFHALAAPDFSNPLVRGIHTQEDAYGSAYDPITSKESRVSEY